MSNENADSFPEASSFREAWKHCVTSVSVGFHQNGHSADAGPMTPYCCARWSASA